MCKAVWLNEQTKWTEAVTALIQSTYWKHRHERTVYKYNPW